MNQRELERLSLGKLRICPTPTKVRKFYESQFKLGVVEILETPEGQLREGGGSCCFEFLGFLIFTRATETQLPIQL